MLTSLLQRTADLPEQLQERFLEEEVARVALARKEDTPKQRRVLIVGGAGYVGGVLTQRFLEEGIGVTVSDILLYENASVVMPFISHPQFRFVKTDLRDAAGMQTALADVTDVVILASMVGDPITKTYPDESREINFDATRAFIQSLSGINKLVFVSTCSNYGLQENNTPAKETSALKPLSIYAETKVEIENFLMNECSDLHYTVLRFATAFGLSSRMRFDLTVSEFTREMFLNNDLEVYDPDTWRPYCHVVDLAGGILRVLDAPKADVSGEVFNVGGDENNYTKRSLIELIQTYLPDAPISYRQHGSDPRNYRVDFSKIQTKLHFTPSMTVRDGIVELIDALKSGVFDDAHLRPNFYGNRKIALFEKESDLV